MSVKPIPPSDLKAVPRNDLIACINTLLAEEWDGTSVTLSSRQIYKLVEANLVEMRTAAQAFREAGWTVKLTESSDSSDFTVYYFKFSKS